MNRYHWKIRTKILVTLVPAMALSIIAIAATIFYSFNALHSDYKALLEDKAFALSESVRQILNQNLAMFPLEGMVWTSTYLSGVVGNNPDISYAFIADKNKIILYHSDENISGVQLNKSAYQRIQYDTIFERLMFPVGDHYEVIVPILHSDQMIGTIHVGLRKELIDSKIFNMMIVSISVLVMAWGAALLLIYWVLQRQIIQPMTVLAEKSVYVSRYRDLNQRMVVNSQDEIGVLSGAFNAMIESLRQYYQDLESKVQERTVELQNRNAQLNSEIEERQRLEASLRVAKEGAEAASQAKSEFLARMSHEIRTPMNAILGMSELLAETPVNANQRDYLRTLQSSGEMLLSIINDILDFSKIEAGQVRLEATPFDLVDLIEGVARIVAPRAHEKGLELAFRIAPDVYPYLLGDPTRLRQILINLLGNAVKFTARGEVVIEVVEVNPPAPSTSPVEPTKPVALRFSVRDTGIGIAPEKHAAVFESFSQADASTTRKYGGTGLGLAICKRLVELMGGQIGLNSEPGEGSKFFFTLAFPRAATIPESWQMPEAEARRALQHQRVLIVDDTSANRLLLHDYLGLWGAQVGMADNGMRAFEEVEHAQQQDHPYTLVLMDIHMPEMDGVQATRLIRERHPAPTLPIVVLTSGELPGDREQLDAVGVQGYLTKPVRRADLFDALLAALGRSVTALEPISIRGGLPPLPPARLLLVEDIAANRKVIEKFLQDSPISIVEAVNGREAVAKATTERFDLILMDVEMPEMDGLEATRQIRAWEAQTGKPRMPIVTLTAHAFNEHRQQCQEAGASDFLAKPVRKLDLLRLLGQWLMQPASPVPETIRETPTGLAEPAEWGERQPPIKVQISEFMRDLLPEFLEELTEARAKMHQATMKGDFGELRRLAHGYKGAAGSYELLTLAQILLGLEQAALSADRDAATACLAEADDYLYRLEVDYI